MDYIRYLRNMVGPKPVIMVTAGVVLFNETRELLLQNRADGTGWGLIGGFIELGETVEQTARREVFEETALTADNYIRYLRNMVGPKPVIMVTA